MLEKHAVPHGTLLLYDKVAEHFIFVEENTNTCMHTLREEVLGKSLLWDIEEYCWKPKQAVPGLA